MNLTAPPKLLGASSTALTGTRIQETSHQFLAEKVREARSPKLPSPPEFSWAANAPFSRFVRKFNDIIGVSADILKTMRGVWLNAIRVPFKFLVTSRMGGWGGNNCMLVQPSMLAPKASRIFIVFHSFHPASVSRSHPFEKQNTGRSQDGGKEHQRFGNFIQGGRISV